MADEHESGSVGQDAFSEEILAWMAAGDALATAVPERAEDDRDDEREVEPFAARVAAGASRVLHLAVVALASWWEALPVPRRRNAIATAIGGLLLLGGLAVSQASSPRRTVAVAVVQAPLDRPVAEPATTTPQVALAKTEHPAARAAVTSSSHAAHPARAKSTSRSQHKHPVMTVPSRR